MNVWQSHALRLMGCQVDDHDDSYWNPTWGWDILRAFNDLMGTQFKAEEFWDLVPVESWHTTPLSTEAPHIINAACSAVGSKEVYFLTSPTRCPFSAYGKMVWIENHFPQMRRRFLIGAPKHTVAQPGHLLVDDADHNCDKFVENGGRAILFPRPWNSAHGMNTYDAIDDIYELAA